MDEFIRMVTEKLGVDAARGKSATAGVMKLIRDQLGDSMFRQLSEQLPGLQGLVDSAAAAPAGDGGGGMLGKLTGLAGSMLGGKAGAVAGLSQAVSDAGIGLDKAPGFLSMLVEFLKNKLGADLFAKISSSLPDLLGKS